MKHRLSDGAGYLMIDHRDSPGLTPDEAAQAPGGVAAAGSTLLERDVMHCTHCQRMVVLHSARVRDRAYCPKCHHYICDGCEAIRVASGGACVPFKQILDRAGAIAEKFVTQPDHPDAVIDPARLSGVSSPSITVPAAPPSIVLTDSE